MYSARHETGGTAMIPPVDHLIRTEHAGQVSATLKNGMPGKPQLG